MAKKLAIFDLDGTLFRWQLYHELVFGLKRRGAFGDDTAKRLDTALIEWQAKTRDWHDYEMEIVRALEASISTISTSVFEEIAQEIVEKDGHKIYNYTKQLAASLKRDGYLLLAISGSQQEIAEPFAARYGFDHCIGALYERDGDRFTGAVSRRVPGRKHEIIAEFLETHPELSLGGSVAIGDSGGDISMLVMVERPIAFNPSSDLLEVARERNWQIVIERKNIAYRLRGETLESIDVL